MYDLDCRYDSRASFYGKAKVVEKRTDSETILELYSYDTLVASITWNYDENKTTYKYLGKYSQTTTRHQKEFFKQYELTDKEIAELFKNGELVEEF